MEDKEKTLIEEESFSDTSCSSCSLGTRYCRRFGIPGYEHGATSKLRPKIDSNSTINNVEDNALIINNNHNINNNNNNNNNRQPSTKVNYYSKKRRRTDVDGGETTKARKTESRLEHENKNKNKNNKKKKKKKKKKSKIMAGPDPPPLIPEPLRQLVESKGAQSPAKLVLQKNLEESDVRKDQNRFSMPVDRIDLPRADFLSEEEETALARRRTMRGDESHLEGLVEVGFIDPRLEETSMTLKQWHYRASSSSSYVLTKNWYRGVVHRHKLEANEIVQMWFFRGRDGAPYFALVRLGKSSWREA
ncbi:B3 domain-containing protein [Trema orientale]|uniref:B3 domain-containing protein n=1 Tax=Trema orientale TaxID=63057 RepID=A0A2P5FIM9_TREOI|nr:B3 domain-containing protein [Trema orientale]